MWRPAALTGEQWRRNNFAATLAVFLLTAGFGFTIPFLPLYLTEIDGLTAERAAFWGGIATGLGGLGSMLTGPVWGILGDRVGRKPMLVRAAFGGSLGLLAFAFADATWQVVVIRFWIGVMAGAPAAAMALIASTTPADRLNHSLGVFQAATQGGLALGPVVAAGLIQGLGYKATFVVTSMIMLAGAFATLVLVQEDRSTLPGRRDKSEPPDPDAVPVRDVLRSQAVLAVFFVILVVNLGRPMTQGVLPGFVEELVGDKDQTVFAVGLLYFGMFAIGAVASVYAARLTVGINRLLLFACLGSGVLLALQGAAQNVWQLTALVWVLAILQGGLQTGTVSLLSAAVPAALVSTIFGVYQSVQAASTQIGPAVGGALAVGVGFRWVFPVAGGLFVVAGVLSYRLLERSDRARDTVAR